MAPVGALRLVIIGLAALVLALAVSTSSWLSAPSAVARPAPTLLPTALPPGPENLP